jgi:hypothetical protein
MSQVLKKNKIPNTSSIIPKEEEINDISENLFRKGPAKLHVFGKVNYDTFNIRDLKSEDQERIKIMFADKIKEAIEDGENKYHYIKYAELFEYVDKRVKTNDDILIGDIIYEAPEYESRPYYGLHIVSYDLEKKCKIYNFNEGMPYIKDKEQIIKLKKNNVTYDNISKYRNELPGFEWWEGFYYSWVQHGIYEDID